MVDLYISILCGMGIILTLIIKCVEWLSLVMMNPHIMATFTCSCASMLQRCDPELDSLDKFGVDNCIVDTTRDYISGAQTT